MERNKTFKYALCNFIEIVFAIILTIFTLKLSDLEFETQVLIAIIYVVFSFVNLVSCIIHFFKLKYPENEKNKKLFVISFIIKLIPWLIYFVINFK